jgi:hypothetical protein
MDTTPKFIKQCEKAEEIQRNFRDITNKSRVELNKSGSFFVFRGQKLPPCIFLCSRYSGRDKRKMVIYSYEGDSQITEYADVFLKQNPIWLPTQTQLQKIAFPLCVSQGICGMPSWSWACIQCLCEFMQKHRELIGGDRVHLPNNSITLEQWWLMLVMEKKYGKHWDNDKEEWVK